MEYHSSNVGGVLIDLSISKSLEWGYKALYLIVFIGLVVPIGYFDSSRTLYYICALLSLTLSLMFSRKELFDPWDYSYLWKEYKEIEIRDDMNS